MRELHTFCVKFVLVGIAVGMIKQFGFSRRCTSAMPTMNAQLLTISGWPIPQAAARFFITPILALSPQVKLMKKLLVFATVLGLAAAITARADDAKDNWTTMCAKCHGDDGKGQTKMGQRLKARDYTDAKVQASFKDEDAAKAIKEGLKDSDGKTLMKPYDTLSDDQIKALVAYIRAFKQ
jgi:cytochrome c6